MPSKPPAATPNAQTWPPTPNYASAARPYGTSQRPEPYSPYCGLHTNDAGQHERVLGAPHLAISAPTRTGKTRRLLAPAAVMHPGPLVAVSSKEDLAELVLMRRGLGPTGVFDLRPEKTLVWPEGVRSMATPRCRSPRPMKHSPSPKPCSPPPVSASAGHPAAPNRGRRRPVGIHRQPPTGLSALRRQPPSQQPAHSWVLEAVENLGIEDDDEGANTQMTLQATPSWLTAAALCPHPMLADPMQRVLSFNSRMRDSVAITVSKAVTPRARLGLSATDHLDRLSAVDQLSIEAFDVSMLDEPDASLFVIAPNTGTVAGAAVIDSIIRHFRKRTAQHQLEHRLLLELDEVCNSCPLPALLNYVGESAGLGVNITATVQASSPSMSSTDPSTPTRCATSSRHRRHVRRPRTPPSRTSFTLVRAGHPTQRVLRAKRWKPLAIPTTRRHHRLARAAPPEPRGGPAAAPRHSRSPRTNLRTGANSSTSTTRRSRPADADPRRPPPEHVDATTRATRLSGVGSKPRSLHSIQQPTA